MLDTAWISGRYGGYVLATYGISLLALLWMGIGAHRQWRRALNLAQRRARDAGTRSLTKTTESRLQ